MTTRLVLATVFLVLAGGLTRAQDKPLERTELDKRVVTTVYEAAVAGTKLFNDEKNYEGTFRLYQGTLLAVAPLLDHRPKLQATVKERLKRAAGMKAADGAFELRTALDEIQNDIAPSKEMKKPLWDRLGGEKAVRAVVDDFVASAAPDPKVNFFRDGKYKLDAKGVEKLKQQLVELVSEVSGGPLKYTGRSMKESHKGMAITDAEFDALAGHLIATLKKFKVPQAEMDELVKIVASTRGDIVEKAPVEPKEVKKPLWDRLGGEKAVKLVVHDFVVAAAPDPKVNFFRDGKYKLDDKGVERLEKLLVELVSEVTGGPLKYTGKSMKESHKGMAITDAEFKALAGHLVATLKKYNVPQAEIDELVKIVSTTYDDIVEKK